MTQPFSMFDLRGQAAFIAGASSGIGLHMARLLARSGAAVMLAARRTDQLADAVAALKAQGHRADAVRLDVGDPATSCARIR